MHVAAAAVVAADAELKSSNAVAADDAVPSDAPTVAAAAKAVYSGPEWHQDVVVAVA